MLPVISSDSEKSPLPTEISPVDMTGMGGTRPSLLKAGLDWPASSGPPVPLDRTVCFFYILYVFNTLEMSVLGPDKSPMGSRRGQYDTVGEGKFQ